MLSSKTLKTFVKMHEYKLNAKINGLKADGLEAGLAHDLQASRYGHGSAAQHWDLSGPVPETRQRPKSRYFDFILTTVHQ